MTPAQAGPTALPVPQLLSGRHHQCEQIAHKTPRTVTALQPEPQGARHTGPGPCSTPPSFRMASASRGALSRVSCTRMKLGGLCQEEHWGANQRPLPAEHQMSEVGSRPSDVGGSRQQLVVPDVPSVGQKTLLSLKRLPHWGICVAMRGRGCLRPYLPPPPPAREPQSPKI